MRTNGSLIEHKEPGKGRTQTRTEGRRERTEKKAACSEKQRRANRDAALLSEDAKGLVEERCGGGEGVEEDGNEDEGRTEKKWRRDSVS